MRRYLFHISELYGFSVVRPLQKAIMARGDDAAWFLENPKKLAEYIRPGEKLLKTVKQVKAYHPCAVFVPGNTVPDFFPGFKIEIFHGFNTYKRNNKRGHFCIRNFFDVYCTQGPETTLPFRELAARHGFFEVIETGWPKMDPLFWETGPVLSKNKQPVVLMTSTFNPSLSAAAPLFDIVRSLAKNKDWRWIVNFHPKMKADVVDRYQAIRHKNFAVVETDDIIPLYKAADLMVSDTSSTIFEFLLQDKPAVTLNNRRPGPHLINITGAEHLEAAITHALTRPQGLMQEIRKYAERIHPYRDGRSSIRVLEAVNDFIQRGRGHLRPRPLNLIRRLKVRRKLKYYRIPG
jgi:CDP-glycerol glycerophosphotransferase (TagB/SpsB family)